MSLRSALYLAARAVGDYHAVRRGPKAITRRLANRLIGRHIVSRMWVR
jgi:hypothetical protein